MPAPIPCPFSPDTLHDLWSKGRAVAVQSAYKELTGDAISNSLALKWLNQAGVIITPYSKFSEKRVDSPFSEEDLHRLYSEEGKAAQEIADAAAQILGLSSLSNSASLRWLHEAGVPIVSSQHRAGIQKQPKAQNKTHLIACPFSPARLREIYWAEENSIEGVARIATETMQRSTPLSPGVVKRWMREFGIPTRDRKTSAKMVAARPEVKSKVYAAILRGSKTRGEQLRQSGGSKAAIKAAQKKSVRKKAAATARANAHLRRKAETRYCNRCDKEITKRPSEFNHPRLAWCSRACALRDLADRRRKEKLNGK